MIQDKDYESCLGTLYRTNYNIWKRSTLEFIDDFVQALSTDSRDNVIASYSLSPRDIALMVKLHYVTPEEAELYNLIEISDTVRI